MTNYCRDPRRPGREIEQVSAINGSDFQTASVLNLSTESGRSDAGGRLRIQAANKLFSPEGNIQASASGLDRQRLLRGTGSQEGPGVIFFAFQTSDVIFRVLLKRFHTKWTAAKAENGPVTLQFRGQLW